jgi:hypothetical protein
VPVDESAAVCRWHDQIRMDVHDLKASDDRQWNAILKMTTTLESVQQGAVELNHALKLQNTALEHHEKTGHRANGETKKDELADNLRRIFWRVVELAMMAGILWVAMSALKAVNP